MSTINFCTEQLITIAKNNPIFSLTEKTLTINEKNRIVTVDLDKISNVRILKYRDLLINYFLIIFLLFTNRIISNIIENNFIFNLVLNSITLIAILASFAVKKYSHFVLINQIGMIFKKYKINPTKVETKSYFTSALKNNLSIFSEKILSSI